jgi:hypothetical protein
MKIKIINILIHVENAKLFSKCKPKIGIFLILCQKCSSMNE